MIHSGPGKVVISIGTQNAGYQHPMGMIGFRVVILVYKVRARHDSPLKLGMVGLDARIEHCRHDRRAAFGDLPSFHGINIRIGRPPALPRVISG